MNLRQVTPGNNRPGAYGGGPLEHVKSKVLSDARHLTFGVLGRISQQWSVPSL